MIEMLTIILLSFFCIILSLYVINNYKNKKLLLENLVKIKSGKISKIYINDKSFYSSIIYNINGIIDTYRNKVTEYKNKDESNNELLTGLSHDIRTPLASLIGYLDALSEDIIDGNERKEYLETAKRKAYDLKDYVDLLFDWFKINSNEMELNFEKIDVNEITREIIIDWIPIFQSKNINLKTDISEKAYFLNQDVKSYKRIINNLIQNAVVHSDCKTLTIQTELSNDKIRITIADDGKGIEKEKIPFIFNNLYKCDRSRNNKGNGLGLSIVKELVKKTNGNIEVISIPYEKTSFDLYFTAIKN